jgi:hypothetical protein
MKILKPMVLLSMVTSLSSGLLASTPKELVEAKCATCHILNLPTPTTLPTLKAPAMEAVLFHVKDAFNGDKKRVKSFILDYVQNPDISKSVCESNKVAKFGVMPSIKGKVTSDELNSIVDYLIENYPSQEFVSLIKEMMRNDRLAQLKASPFLMNQDALPHLTKILIQNWTKGTLGLTSEQKDKLLVVRKDTLRDVKRIKKELSKIEPEIIEMLVDNEDSKKIEAKLKRVADLKLEGSLVHFKCIKDSINILNEKQIELLLPFWNM